FTNSAGALQGRSRRAAALLRFCKRPHSRASSPGSQGQERLRSMGDVADADAVRDFERRLAAGDEELIPAAFVNRIMDGENKVHVWRCYSGMSVRELATAASLSAPYNIAEIESGKKECGLS